MAWRSRRPPSGRERLQDHFSAASADYAVYRPTYPSALVDFLAEVSPATELALDCGCGNGQLSVLLAARFTRVIATDASAKQIASAQPQCRVPGCSGRGERDAGRIGRSRRCGAGG